jgi:hypothetical protein
VEYAAAALDVVDVQVAAGREDSQLRTVRGWVIGMVVAAILTVFAGLFAAGNATTNCSNSPNGPTLTGKACLPCIPHGPGGEVVTDSFNFAHQPLTGNGTITVRVISLTGEHPNVTNGHGAQVGAALVPGLAPWSKAGIIIKQSLHQGSAHAAMMVTGSNGVRMQYNYTADTAGLPGKVSAADPRWLRLTRSGDTITGYDSTDGAHWAKVGSVTLTGFPATVQAGIAAMIRDSAVSVGAALGVLYVFPISLAFVTSTTWQHRLERWTPTVAGLNIQATTGVRSLPISPWGGLGVLGIWAGVALLAGGTVLRFKDA